MQEPCSPSLALCIGQSGQFNAWKHTNYSAELTQCKHNENPLVGESKPDQCQQAGKLDSESNRMELSSTRRLLKSLTLWH